MRPVSIMGCGYTGLRLAQRFQAMGAAVTGYATRPESIEAISAAGVNARSLNLETPPQGPKLNFTGQLIYYSVPPGTNTPRASSDYRDLRLEHFLDYIDTAGFPASAPHRLIYLSTTGVYGDQAGAVVTEDTKPAPKNPRAMRRLKAEECVRNWSESHRVSWCILRIPGIYGPGRLPLERLRRSEPAITPAEATPGNRIQVEDLVTACVAAGQSARAEQRIFNITDGSEDSLTDYLQRVARITELPTPPLISRAAALRTFSDSTWSFLGESRRVSNHRMLDELGVALAYHDLDAGIRASL